MSYVIYSVVKVGGSKVSSHFYVNFGHLTPDMPDGSVLDYYNGTTSWISNPWYNNMAATFYSKWQHWHSKKGNNSIFSSVRYKLKQSIHDQTVTTQFSTALFLLNIYAIFTLVIKLIPMVMYIMLLYINTIMRPCVLNLKMLF